MNNYQLTVINYFPGNNFSYVNNYQVFNIMFHVKHLTFFQQKNISREIFFCTYTYSCSSFEDSSSVLSTILIVETI